MVGTGCSSGAGSPSGTPGLCTAAGHRKGSGDLTHPPLLFAQGDIWGAFSLMLERVQSPGTRSRTREKWQYSKYRLEPVPPRPALLPFLAFTHQDHIYFCLKHLGRAAWFPWSLPCQSATPWTFLWVQGSRYRLLRCVPTHCLAQPAELGAAESPAQGRISVQELSGVALPTPAASAGTPDFVTPIPSHFSQRDLAEHSLCGLHRISAHSRLTQDMLLCHKGPSSKPKPPHKEEREQEHKNHLLP